MKEMGLSLKVKKQNIIFRRKIITFYTRLTLAIKIIVFFLILLVLCTNFLDKLKQEIKTFLYEISAEIGFRLENILVEGQHNLSIDEILLTLDADKGTAIFAINLSKIQKILSNNPWVKDVSVARHMPNTIYIILYERVPIAIWQINRKLFLIDNEGYKISSIIEEKFSNLLHIIGSDANIYAEELISIISKYPKIRNKILSAIRFGERRWNLNLEQGITVKMPEKNFHQALIYIDKLNNINKLFNQNYKVLDLRDLNKFYFEKY